MAAFDFPELQYSQIVDSSTYNSQGLCDGYIARRNILQDAAIRASLRCREDFDRAVGGIDLEDIVTYENPTHGHSALMWIPMTIPERVDVIGYTAEYFCLHDDEEDFANMSATLAADRKAAQKTLLKQLLARFISIDQKQGIAIAENFAEYGKMAASLSDNRDFQTIEQYIDYRYHDYGSEFILAVTMFAVDIDPLTPQEKSFLSPFIRTGFQAISLMNDYFSFDIEYASTPDKDSIVNGVYVLMKLHSLSVSEAKDGLRKIAAQFDQEYKQRWEMMTAQDALSPRMQKIVTAIAHQVVGNMVWSSTSLRYNVEYRLRNRANRKRIDSLVAAAAVTKNISTVAKAVAGHHRSRSDSLIEPMIKAATTPITITTTEIVPY